MPNQEVADSSIPACNDPEDRRAHLEFIQSVVTRMAASSASAKEWLLPVVTATFGFALTSDEHRVPVALLGIVAVLVFAALDANYLNQERAFRCLYDAVARGKDVPPFSMNSTLAAPEKTKPIVPTGLWRQVWVGVRGWVPPMNVWSSWAIAPFYGSLLLVGLLVVLCVG